MRTFIELEEIDYGLQRVLFQDNEGFGIALKETLDQCLYNIRRFSTLHDAKKIWGN